jgi:hypothetical protein
MKIVREKLMIDKLPLPTDNALDLISPLVRLWRIRLRRIFDIVKEPPAAEQISKLRIQAADDTGFLEKPKMDNGLDVTGRWKRWGKTQKK